MIAVDKLIESVSDENRYILVPVIKDDERGMLKIRQKQYDKITKDIREADATENDSFTISKDSENNLKITKKY